MPKGMRGFQKGSLNSKWAGGRSILPTGYIQVYRPEHPQAQSHGYIYEHRLVMEEKLGRPLERSERVHHLNGDRADNRPENLDLYHSNAEHMRQHHAQTWAARDALRQRARELYESGLSTVEVAAMMDRGIPGVNKWLRQMGVTRKQPEAQRLRWAKKRV